MTQEWNPLWNAVLPDAEQRWQEVLRRAPGGAADEPLSLEFCPVSTETFAQAVREGSGGAGFDGWTAKELKGLGVSCPSLWDDLVCILNDCVALAAQGACVQCQDQFSWRVVGIPKRCEAAVRPIAIASAIIRAYNRALLPQFPSMPADQYCGAPGRTAATATVAWLATKAYRGAELDLRKAFDSVDHVVASSAARTAGVPEAIIAYLARCVWSAPRHCVVHGEPPAEVIAATTGLPAGDPCSPRLLAFVLEPWSRIVTSFGGIQAFLFMDDRSLTDRLEQGHLAEALEASKWFDTRLGLQEHQGKRQVWDRSLRADCPPVEHLGVFAVPEQHALPEVRVHEDEVCQLADAVAGLPGGMEVKERLLLGIVLAKITWAAPLVPAVSLQTAKAFYRAMRGPCTWWCQGRVWADCINVHPQLAAAVLCLRRTAGCQVHSSATLDATVKHHAGVLGLEVVGEGPTGVLLASSQAAKPLVIRAVQHAARAQGRQDGSFAADADAGHSLRVVARAVALAQVKDTRADAEGIGAVDLQAQSDPAWKLWRQRLSPRDRGIHIQEVPARADNDDEGWTFRSLGTWPWRSWFAFWVAMVVAITAPWNYTLIRFFTGCAGDTFATNQLWCSLTFARNVVGTANADAIAASWGILGSGVTQIFMMSVLFSLMVASGMEPNLAGHVSMVVPVVMLVICSICMKLMCEDMPTAHNHDPAVIGNTQRLAMWDYVDVLLYVRGDVPLEHGGFQSQSTTLSTS
ncbi:NRT2.5 [Symbiodinium sp. KB8]|nr:NRT2.5 [Symbiodinium sp. KB8]